MRVATLILAAALASAGYATAQPPNPTHLLAQERTQFLLDTTFWVPPRGTVVKVFPRGTDGRPTPSQLWRLQVP